MIGAWIKLDGGVKLPKASKATSELWICWSGETWTLQVWHFVFGVWTNVNVDAIHANIQHPIYTYTPNSIHPIQHAYSPNLYICHTLKKPSSTITT